MHQFYTAQACAYLIFQYMRVAMEISKIEQRTCFYGGGICQKSNWVSTMMGKFRKLPIIINGVPEIRLDLRTVSEVGNVPLIAFFSVG